MNRVQNDPRGHCRLVHAEVIPAPDRMPARDEHPFRGADSLDDALIQCLGAYTESRLEQISYPETLTSRGWRFALRYMAVVIAGERGVDAIKKIDEAYPLRPEQD